QAAGVSGPPAKSVRLRGEIVDAETGELIPTRVYVQRDDGQWFFPKSMSAHGTVVEYRRQRTTRPQCIEMHTTLSAHPFVVELPPGKYTLTAERGKEYVPLSKEVIVGTEPMMVRLELHRWIDMARFGWFSGDTHVHRSVDELHNLMPAEDLNVA